MAWREPTGPTLLSCPAGLACLQVAEATYRDIFGDDFDKVIPLYNTKPSDALLYPWHNQRLRLDRLLLQQRRLGKQQAELGTAAAEAAAAAGAGGAGQLSGEAPARGAAAKWWSSSDEQVAAKRQKQAEGLAGRQEKLAQKVAKTERKLAELQGKIEAAQGDTAEALPAPCFFATFRSATAAAYAARLNLNPLHERMMR